MKRITYFGKKTLDTFIINLTYERLLPGIELEKVNPFAEAIQAYYPTKPLLGLLKRRFTEINLAPLTFWDANKRNRVELGQDYLLFTFSDYQEWDRELPKVLKVLNALGVILDLPKISKIVLTYIDIFTIPKEPFTYNHFFTMPNFNFEHEWKIKFYDTILGFVPFEEDLVSGKRKIVIRFKSLPQNHGEVNYNFRLETVGSVANISIAPDPEFLNSHLNECHDRIEDYFINFLTEEYRVALELEVEDY